MYLLLSRLRQFEVNILWKLTVTMVRVVSRMIMTKEISMEKSNNGDAQQDAKSRIGLATLTPEYRQALDEFLVLLSRVSENDIPSVRYQYQGSHPPLVVVSSGAVIL